MVDKTSQGQNDDRPVILPVYLVFDVSGSMNGCIAALNQALHDFRDGLAKEPILSDKTRFGILDFADDARVVVALADLTEAPMQATPLAIRGGTSFAAAFRKLREVIETDVRGKSGSVRYFRPAVYFLTDGFPNLNDPWQPAFTDLTAFNPETGVGFEHYPLFVPFGFGDADRSLLQSLVYPPNRGQLFMARDGSNPVSVLKTMLEAMLKSTLLSARTATTNNPQHVLPTKNDVGPDVDVYPGGNFVGE